MAERRKIPRQLDGDYTREAADARRDFVREATGDDLEHVSSYSFDPDEASGNIENFMGVAQVPIGLAGPLLVDGEHAKGEFYVPLATAEGTLVASYNRGMRLLHEAGGVKTTILDDRMQRAPAFLFPSAREAREFGDWLAEQSTDVREAADTTTRSGRLQDVEQYLASRIVFTRFNYTTGDAAGQNLTGKATQAACDWIQQNYPRRTGGLLPRVQLRHRQEELTGEHAAHARQAGRGRGDPAQGPDRRADARRRRPPLARAARVEPRRLHVRRQQQRRPLRQRHHGDVHRHRAGRCERRRVVRGAQLQRGAPERRLLRLGDDPVADRGDLRWRHRPAHPARVPGDARLLRKGQCEEARRDRRRHGAVRRALARLRDRGRRVGQGPRPVRAQPALDRRSAPEEPAAPSPGQRADGLGPPLLESARKREEDLGRG